MLVTVSLRRQRPSTDRWLACSRSRARPPSTSSSLSLQNATKQPRPL